ncbi:hypothetical protein DICPUDRAFT_152778 [Dictyostelium purpureum]|uniref:Uncharacterized protein n=1 Tax=Dictyostelium purpureum TaxID=5786 RepID=F0ZM92_DICPU|nr:uncharacterized protein DICPUDRAFT_152778 [Dictyostelium purpureum]EGC34957.1 hypothetical protein DICPUDRAFT_152778 [Dictyostelium purpureum]|eukprot:XP_003288538.1 hypothetical protein DICPUDRAFT_152778 [Dictyostelium purpureum]
MDNKRKNENGIVLVDNNNNGSSGGRIKKQKGELAVITKGEGREIILGTERTSKLEHPIIQLTGHKGEVYTCKFNSYGTALASGGFDKEIFLWNVYGECINYSVLKGHKGTILELHWSTDSNEIYSACTDKSIGVWDANKGELIKRIREHTAVVNSCYPARRGPPLVASGSDDGTARVFDTRSKGSTHTLKHKYPITSVCFSDASDQLISGGLDNIIRIWDLRNDEEPLITMNGHQDTISGMSVSKDGAYLLSNSMDNTLRQWDIRPYAPQNRNIKTFIGAQNNFEKNLIKCSFSPDSRRVATGSSDRQVYIWDSNTTKIQYCLPGHNGTVNEVAFHPNEPIIASASSDKSIYLGEIKL